MRFTLPLTRSAITLQPIIALSIALPILAASPGPEKGTAIDLELSPAAAPTPALRYRLLPTAAERKAGSAYPFYARLTAEKGDGFKKLIGQASDFLDRPIDELDSPEVRQYLSRFRRVLRELELASRRERCDWEYPIGEVDSYTMLLPDANQSRMFWRLQALQVRHLVATGSHDEAIKALQVGFTMARHIEQAPFVVHDLIGAACARTMLAQIVELVQSPDAPNLYWALTSLPRPLVDILPSIELEMDLLELSYPETKQLDRLHTADDWKSLLDSLLRTELEYASDSPLKDQRKFVAYLVKCHAKAHRYFLSREIYTSAQLDAMSLEELLVRWVLHPYEEVRDERFKWNYVPFQEAQAFIGQVSNEKLADPNQSPFVDSITRFATFAGRPSALTQQHIAALRVVEALRMHAAANGGRLPSQLSEVELVPIPVDPMTGKTFHYELKGNTAELSSTYETSGAIDYRLHMRPVSK